MKSDGERQYAQKTMAQNPETQALLEHAGKHVLKEQGKILGHEKAGLFIEGARLLGELASRTWDLLAKGYHKIGDTSRLTKLAIKCENAIDDVSEASWVRMEIAVSAIFERVEESFKIRPIEEKLNLGAAIQVRNHFHNLKVALLGQLLGARMLINANDYGSELQRVWQDFLQRQLGSGFRVLEGGHIMDHKGNNGNAQIDLLIVPDDAQVLVPSDLSNGKINVLCDQVIAAIMITATLSPEKLREDWAKLERVSGLFKFTDEFPNGKDQTWPLSYIVAGQSVDLKTLEKTWQEIAKQTPDSKFAPQFVVALDSGFIWSSLTSWPRPSRLTNCPVSHETSSETGIYTGLGIAWMLNQIRGRANLLKGQSTKPIQRFNKLLNDATMKNAMWPTFSSRFNVFFVGGPIHGVIHWGRASIWQHNRLHLISLERNFPGMGISNGDQIYRSNIDLSEMNWESRSQYLRWFHHGVAKTEGDLVAVEEWTRVPNEARFVCSYAVFNSCNGNEVSIGPCASLEEALREALALSATEG